MLGFVRTAGKSKTARWSTYGRQRMQMPRADFASRCGYNDSWFVIVVMCLVAKQCAGSKTATSNSSLRVLCGIVTILDKVE